MLKTSELWSMYSISPMLLVKKRPGDNMNQYGLKPTNFYDFLNPTNLVNFGQSTRMDTLGSRMGNSGEKDSTPTLSGYAMGTQVKMLGISKSGMAGESLSFCSSETAILRVCMAKGTSSCEMESANLDSCLKRVSRVKSAITRAGHEFTGWFNQQINDNHTKPFQHRPQDWRHAKEQEQLGRTDAQGFLAKNRRPKLLVPYKEHYAKPGRARTSRMPVNK
eukprot:GILI01018577.1.p1 GENE.GILI01018577.1~~GILI01018577.1.p1  ORF type:complete len:220 (+),score=24.20 GILI01018577.1:98-757(+)